MKNPDKLAT